MRCDKAIENLDNFLEGSLSPGDRSALEGHLAACPECQETFAAEKLLVAQLRALPVPPPTEAFFERAIARAVRTHEHHREQHRRSAWRFAAGGALAASLVLGVMMKVTPPTAQAPMQMALPGLNISLHEVQKVRLSVDSSFAMQDAVFTVELPAGVELAGFPEQRTVQWKGPLRAGKNLLELPLVAQDSGGGVLVARIDHADKQKVFRLQLNIQPGRGADGTTSSSQGWV